MTPSGLISEAKRDYPKFRLGILFILAAFILAFDLAKIVLGIPLLVIAVVMGLRAAASAIREHSAKLAREASRVTILTAPKPTYLNVGASAR
jgi:hypothetical protein